MATVTAGTSTGSTGSGVATSLVPVTLSSEQAVANGAGPEDSTNVAFRGTRTLGGAIVITNTGGAGPTVTVNIKGSMDGTTWFNVPYALVGTPRTFVITAITLTTTATNTYILQEGVPYQYLKLAYSTTTNETITATAYV